MSYDGSLEADLAALGIGSVRAETQSEKILRAAFEYAEKHKKPVSLAELSKLTGIRQGCASGAISRMVLEGKLHRVGYGWYVPANVAALKAKYGRGGE